MKDSYAGKVKGAGAQLVQAPLKAGKVKNAAVLKGGDLRSGKKK